MVSKHCTLCREPFWFDPDDPEAHGYGDVLEHWAKSHDDSEIFWNVLENYRTHTRCGGCGEMFVSQIMAGENGLLVRLYCDDCAEDDYLREIIVDEVTGRYVLEHSIEVDDDEE